jgi:hypothetical protein
MSNNSSGQDLIEIIAAMSGSERRYFRMYALQWGHTSEKVLKLYDFIVKAGAWQEDAIRKAFAGETFLNQLNVTRTRLQETVLAALRGYDNGRTYQLDFSRRLDEIDVLFRRKLISPCLRVAMAAQRRAQLLELPMQELSVLGWLLRLERQKGGVDLAQRMTELHHRHRFVSRQVTIEAELLEIHDAMLVLLPQQASHPAQCKVQAESLLLSPPLLADPAAMAFDARILYYYTHCYHALIQGNYDGYHSQYRRLVDTWEALPDRMRMEEERTFKTYVGYAESAALAGQMAAIPKTIAKLKRLLANSSSLRPVEQARILNIEMACMVKTSNHEEGVALLPQVETCIKTFAETIPASIRLGLLSNSLAILASAAQWQHVLKWASLLETEIGPSGTEQFQWLVRATRWVAWYELHQHETLEKALRPLLKITKSAAPDPLALGFAALLASETEAQEQEAYAALQAAVQAQQAVGNLPHLNLLETWAIARLQ